MWIGEQVCRLTYGCPGNVRAFAALPRLINGHPDPESFGAALAEAYRLGAATAGAEVQEIRIGQLQFDPNLAHGFFRGVGEVMFQDNLLTGLIFLVAIAVNSPELAVWGPTSTAIGAAAALSGGWGGNP